MKVSFRLNGNEVSADVEAGTRLLDLLRDQFRMTSVKEGCGIGACGACTVVLNREAVCSCLTLAIEADGGDVLTTEGLSKDGILSPLQQAFLRHAATQCGYCTPGFLMSAAALLMKTPHPTEDQVRRAVAGNLCRCTGYRQIVDAVLDAAGPDGGEGRQS